MATLTATAAAATGPVRNLHAGVISISSTYSGTTAISPSATTVLMCKIPNRATILDVVGTVSSGAATCPFTLGVSNGSLSSFATGGTITSALRATKGIPYDVSLSDDAAAQFVYVNLTATPGTATTEVEAKVTVLYTMDR